MGGNDETYYISLLVKLFVGLDTLLHRTLPDPWQ